MKEYTLKAKFLLIILFLSSITAFSQVVRFDLSDNAAIARITNDLTILSSDSLLGREAGTYAEEMARDYIVKKFIEIGLKPYFGDTSFLQEFVYSDKPYLTKDNFMSVNSKNLRLYKDYYPLSYSGNSAFSGEVLYVGYGTIVPDLDYDDYKNISNTEGKVLLIDTNVPKEIRSKDDFQKYIKKISKIEIAIKKGAKAIIFVVPEPDNIFPSPELSNDVKDFNIPIVFVKDKSIIKSGDNVSISVDIKKVSKRTSFNIAGYIDNKAKTTIIFGAHYDHLGNGWFGSRKNGVYDVYNGADDNASGTVGVIELARQLSNSGMKYFNFLFIAFSGEEKGLYGSNYFVKSKDVNLSPVNCMIDLDMIGRLNKSKTVKVFGTGTSSNWKKILKLSDLGNLDIVMIKSQVDGSDHIPFYNKGIPVLFFNTGLHADYHTAADVIKTINIPGEMEILRFVLRLVSNIDKQEKMNFSETTKWQMISGLRHFIL